MLLPPPPQAGTNAITARSRSNPVDRRRAGDPNRTTEKNAKKTIASQREYEARPGEASFAVVAAAVVVTVIVDAVVAGVPAAATVEGLNVQAAPTGRPEHTSEMVPLNPVELATASEVVPADPGAVTVTDA